MVTSASSSVPEDYVAGLFKLYCEQYNKLSDFSPKKDIKLANHSKYDELYKRDKQFALYIRDAENWRYSVHGDDRGVISSEICLRWAHLDENSSSEQKDFLKLKNFLEKEGLLA